MDRHLQLEAALARAEAELADAAISAADAGGDREEAVARLEKARDHCRQMRAVYEELDRSALLAFPCLSAGCGLVFSPNATCWIRCLDDTRHELADWHDREHCPYRPAAPARRPGRAPTAIAESPRGPEVASRRPGKILRPTLGLITLVLAYQFYFHMDIQVQILRLPMLFWMLPP